jgi:hypothetical protein
MGLSGGCRLGSHLSRKAIQSLSIEIMALHFRGDRFLHPVQRFLPVGSRLEQSGPTSESSVIPAQSRHLPLWGGQGIFYLIQLSGQWMGHAFVACRRRC